MAIALKTAVSLIPPIWEKDALYILTVARLLVKHLNLVAIKMIKQ